MKRLLLLLAVLCLAGAAGPAHAERTRMSAQDAYELGLRYLKRGYYQKALEQFNRVRTYYRDDPYALKADLAIADVHYKKNEWEAARLGYEDFMHAHPRYRELDFVVYRYGSTMFKQAPAVAARDQTWTRQALHAWTGFPSRFPESTYLKEVDEDLGKARDRMARKELLVARFYDRRGAWVSVAGRTDGLLRDYPNSPDRHEALALGGVAAAHLGDLEKARAALVTLEQDAPDGPAARRLRKELRKLEALPAPAAPPTGGATATPASPVPGASVPTAQPG